ncbi:MAG: hypothetical protein HYW26_00455 [Candidatus Aenigmarchaeota archaeon]|nr:hypothetical protein [Candidatus Aenigmarchaeota archaeon]
MANPVVSFVLLTAIALTAVFITLNVGAPAVDSARTGEGIREAESVMIKIDNAVREVAKEGLGSKRVVKFKSPGGLEVIPQEDVVQYRTESNVAVVDYLSRKTGKNILYMGGADVICDSSANLTMENTFFKAVLLKVNNATPLPSLSTKDIIISLTEKESGTQINVTNSTIAIDSNATLAGGTGFTELLRTGRGLPSCTSHAFVNVSNSISYDVYYTLYAGADFLKVDVRNVRTP